MADPAVFFDFEDGQQPAEFAIGHVVPGPPRPGNKGALMGTLLAWAGDPFIAVRLHTEAPLVIYPDSLVIAFDYWLGSDGGDMFVEIRNLTHDRNFIREVARPKRDQWAHAAIRLSAFRRGIDGPTIDDRPMDPGDPLRD